MWTMVQNGKDNTESGTYLLTWPINFIMGVGKGTDFVVEINLMEAKM